MPSARRVPVRPQPAAFSATGTFAVASGSDAAERRGIGFGEPVVNRRIPEQPDRGAEPCHTRIRGVARKADSPPIGGGLGAHPSHARQPNDNWACWPQKARRFPRRICIADNQAAIQFGQAAFSRPSSSRSIILSFMRPSRTAGPFHLITLANCRLRSAFTVL